jgi:hypothetical protein
MRCLDCSSEIPLGTPQCPVCGTARPQLETQFSNLESRFISLHNKFQAKEIDLATFQVESQKLVIQDNAGNSWWLGGETGQWYLHDGQEWVPNNPPIAESISPSPGPPTRKGRIKWALVAVPVFLALLCVCTAALYFSGFFDTVTATLFGSPVPTEMSLTTEEVPGPAQATSIPSDEEPALDIPTVRLSDQQQLLVDEFGWPDSFTILEADVEQGEPVRYETWTYYKGLITFTFFDGIFQVEGEAEMLPTGFIPAPYRPTQFTLGASLEQVDALLLDYPLVPLENSEVVNPGAEMFVAQQLVLGFINNHLFYVDALAFVPEGSER